MLDRLLHKETYRRPLAMNYCLHALAPPTVEPTKRSDCAAFFGFPSDTILPRMRHSFAVRWHQRSTPVSCMQFDLERTCPKARTLFRVRKPSYLGSSCVCSPNPSVLLSCFRLPTLLTARSGVSRPPDRLASFFPET